MLGPCMSASARARRVSPRAVRMHLMKKRWCSGRMAMCGMLCALLGTSGAQPVRAVQKENACLHADRTTQEQIVKLSKTKDERYRISDPGDLKPWMDKVRDESKAVRGNVTKGLGLCRNDQELGQRARAAVVSRLKKRVRQLDETDKQLLMMQSLSDPYPRIDPSIMRVLEH